MKPQCFGEFWTQRECLTCLDQKECYEETEKIAMLTVEKCYGRYGTQPECLRCFDRSICERWTKRKEDGVYDRCPPTGCHGCRYIYQCEYEERKKQHDAILKAIEEREGKNDMENVEVKGAQKTEILKVKGDWEEVADDARSTVGKAELGHEPSEKFKRGMLLAEHSPIRDIAIKWRWKDIPHWVGVHWVRHKWECFVRTQRSDRTGVDRSKLPQDQPQTFVGEANCQALIDTMRKRLCYQASPETREYAEDLKAAIHGVQPELSDVLVPNCIYRCGCPEMNCCGLFRRLCEEDIDCASSNIQTRYDAYNKIFWAERKKDDAE